MKQAKPNVYTTVFALGGAKLDIVADASVTLATLSVAEAQHGCEWNAVVPCAMMCESRTWSGGRLAVASRNESYLDAKTRHWDTVVVDRLRGRIGDDDSGENDMIKKAMVMLAVAGILGGCENMSSGQKGAVTGGALGAGIGMVAGGSFGQVVGAGLIGGAVGYVGGSALGK